MKVSLTELRRLEVKRRVDGWPLDYLVLTHVQVELAWPALLTIAEAARTWKIAPSWSGPKECTDHAGRETAYGHAYAAGYRARQAELERALEGVEP
jgi:hypothetical protein